MHPMKTCLQEKCNDNFQHSKIKCYICLTSGNGEVFVEKKDFEIDENKLKID